MNHRLQSFIEAHPWAAPIVAVLAWLVNAGVWLFEHPDHISKWFAAASAILGFGVLWYTFRIKRREFRRGATHAPFANREDDDDFDPQDPSGLR